MTSSFPETAVCLHCGYSLRGLPESVCPECGRGFEPADPTTFAVPRQGWCDAERRRMLELAAPPGNEEVVIAILAGLAALVPLWFWPAPILFAQGATGNMAKLLGIPLLAATCWYSLLRYFCTKRYGKHADQSHARWRWWVAPFLLTIVLAACVTSWPFRLRFQISLPFIKAEAAQLAAHHMGTMEPGWIGLFGADRLVVHGDGRIRVILKESSHNRSGQSELSFEPNGPKGSEHTYAFSFGGDWYLRQWGREY